MLEKDFDTVVHNPWPTLITQLDLPDEQAVDLNSEIYMVAKNKLAEVSDHSLWTHNAQVFHDFGDHPIVQKLEDIFMAGFRKAYESYGREFPECSRDNILDSWFSWDPLGSGASLHCHADAVFTAVYYVSVLPEEGPINYYDPRWAGGDLPYVGNAEFQLKPKNGRMYISPANVWHEVPRFKPSEPRLAIVCNFKLSPNIRTKRTMP